MSFPHKHMENPPVVPPSSANEAQNAELQKQNKANANVLRQQQEDYAAYAKALEQAVFNPAESLRGTDGSDSAIFRATVATHLGIPSLRDQLHVRRVFRQFRPSQTYGSLLVISVENRTVGAMAFRAGAHTLEYLDAALHVVSRSTLQREIQTIANVNRLRQNEALAKQTEQLQLGALEKMISEIEQDNQKTFKAGSGGDLRGTAPPLRYHGLLP